MTRPELAKLIEGLSDSDASRLRHILQKSTENKGSTNAFVHSLADGAKEAIDAAYVKQRWRNLFQRIVDLSMSAQPPGAHAGNGFFRDFLVGDRVLASMGAPPTVPLSPQARALFDVYSAWHTYVRVHVFGRAPNVPANRTFDFLLSEIDGILEFAVKLINFIFGSEEERKKALQSMAQEFEPLVKRLNDSGNMPRIGSHMNGHLAKFSSDTAFFTITLLDQRVPGGVGGEIGQVANVIRNTMIQLNRMEVNGHNPWLKGVWQLQYQATLKSAILGLDAILTLPLDGGRAPLEKADEPRLTDVPTDVGPLLMSDLHDTNIE
jgi:hypothetical protein